MYLMPAVCLAIVALIAAFYIGELLMRIKCPYCRKRIAPDATKCAYCCSELPRNNSGS
jgi:hypothetical protein